MTSSESLKIKTTKIKPSIFLFVENLFVYLLKVVRSMVMLSVRINPISC